MGYYTNYKLRVSKKSEVKDEDVNRAILILDLERITNGYEFYDEGSYLELSDAKWYDHEDQMKKLTLEPQYKDVLFELKGDGEESGDTWMAIVRNGAYIRGVTKVTYVFGDMEIIDE